MSSSQRDFLQRSATAAAAISLGPLARDGVAQALDVRPDAAAAPETPASIRAFEARLLRARPVPLGNVRLTAGPLKHAQEMNGKYLLELQADRMLAYYRERAGLPQKAVRFQATGTTGHIASVFGVRSARTKNL